MTEDIVTIFQNLPAQVASDLQLHLTEKVNDVIAQARQAIHVIRKEVEHA